MARQTPSQSACATREGAGLNVTQFDGREELEAASEAAESVSLGDIERKLRARAKHLKLEARQLRRREDRARDDRAHDRRSRAADGETVRRGRGISEEWLFGVFVVVVLALIIGLAVWDAMTCAEYGEERAYVESCGKDCIHTVYRSQCIRRKP